MWQYYLNQFLIEMIGKTDKVLKQKTAAKNGSGDNT